LIFATLAFAGVLSAANVRADNVDTAVDVIAEGLTVAGVSIGESEKTLVKSLVRCVGGKKSVLACARDELINKLPPEAQPFARCLAQRQDLPSCAATTAIDALPSETCVLASCIARGENVAECGKNAAADAAMQSALQTIDKLKADARSELGALNPGPIRNIINIAEGIAEEDWGKVAFYGGVEIYKAAVKAVLRVLLSEVFAPAIGPIVDAIVEHRVDLAVNMIDALKKKDAPKATALALEFYFTMNLVPPCALAEAVLGSDFAEITCGTLGKVYSGLANFGGDVVGFAVNAGDDVLDVLGLSKDEDKCKPTSHFYAQNYLKCAHRSAYLSPGTQEFEDLVGLVNHHCFHHYRQCNSDRDAQQRFCNPLNSRFREEAEQLRAGLKKAADFYMGALPEFFASKGGRGCQQDFDTIEMREFLGMCENALKKQAPLGADPSRVDCAFQAQQFSAPSAHMEFCRRALQQTDMSGMKNRACQIAFEEWTQQPKTVFDPKRGAPNLGGLFQEKPRIPVPAHAGLGDNQGAQTFNPWRQPAGVGALPGLSGGRDGSGSPIPQTPCAAGMVLTAKGCGCEEGKRWNGQSCAAPLALQYPLGPTGGTNGVQDNPCGGGMIPAASGGCGCAGTMRWDGGSCVFGTAAAPPAATGGTSQVKPTEPCPAGTVGTPPFCRVLAKPSVGVKSTGTDEPILCPPRTRLLRGKCRRIAVKTPPRYVPPRDAAPRYETRDASPRLAVPRDASPRQVFQMPGGTFFRPRQPGPSARGDLIPSPRVRSPAAPSAPASQGPAFINRPATPPPAYQGPAFSNRPATPPPSSPASQGPMFTNRPAARPPASEPFRGVVN